MDIEYCKFCDRTLPLTEEFWHRNNKLPSSFATNMCKKCRRVYCKDRAHKYRRDKKLELEQFMPEHFGSFEKAAMKDRIKRLNQFVCSMDMEI